MKRFPMAVLISLSREGLICSLTRALKRDKMYLAQKAYQKDEGGSGWAEKREIRLLSSCLTILNFLAKIPFVLQDNWYKTPQ